MLASAALQEARSPASEVPAVGIIHNHQELFAYFQAELSNNRIADPYDERWWGKRITKKQYYALDKALDAFLNDTERDDMAETALYQALKECGIDLYDHLQDAVHAANHLVNNTKTPHWEPNPEQIEEDYGGQGGKQLQASHW